jgi:hypothetical protein
MARPELIGQMVRRLAAVISVQMRWHQGRRRR